MAVLSIPFHKNEITVDIPDKNLLGVLEPKTVRPLSDPLTVIKQALKSPINSKPLIELAKGKKRVTIVVTDITRPCPDSLLLPPVIEELQNAGVKTENITILVATGLHRPNTEDELVEKLGSQIVENIKVVNHVGYDDSGLTYLGNTKYGCPVWVNKLVLQADLVISTGIIEPHFFAGFSGGRKSIAIGVAGEETIMFQHRPAVFDHPQTKLGNISGNIFHENAMEIAEMAGLGFIVNAVLNDRAEIAGIVAGDFREAFYRGVEMARDIYEVEIAGQADIAIAGVGFPKDTNLYQATRGASCIAFSQFPSVKRGGLIITPAQTEEGAGEGLGEKRFYDLMSKASNIDELIDNIRANGYPAGGQRAYLLALTLKHADLIITNSKTPDIVQDMHMKAMASLQEALNYGLERFGEDAKVVVLPHSIQVMTVKGGDA